MLKSRSRSDARGFTLVEVLVVIAVTGLVIALLLFAVQSARESARRSVCVNSLKQLGMAALNYESSNGVLPPGALAAPHERKPGLTWGLSTLVRILPYIDCSPLYNSANFAFPALAGANATLASTRLDYLLCPSDPFASTSGVVDADYGAPAGTGFRQEHTSYGGCQGMWSLEILPTNPAYDAQRANMNGVIFSCSETRLADVTDGTATTILFGETAFGRIPKAGDRTRARRWNSGFVADSMVTAYYPVNGGLKGVSYRAGTFDQWVMTVGSFHPGGAHVGFCDGSVRFVKDTTESVPFDPATGAVLAFRRDPTTGTYSVAPGVRLGVWQKLATRNTGGVVAADAF